MVNLMMNWTNNNGWVWQLKEKQITRSQTDLMMAMITAAVIIRGML